MIGFNWLISSGGTYTWFPLDTQCAAVRTHLAVISDPPHVSEPDLRRATWCGNWLGLAGDPPTMRDDAKVGSSASVLASSTNRRLLSEAARTIDITSSTSKRMQKGIFFSTRDMVSSFTPRARQDFFQDLIQSSIGKGYWRAKYMGTHTDRTLTWRRKQIEEKKVWQGIRTDWRRKLKSFFSFGLLFLPATGRL